MNWFSIFFLLLIVYVFADEGDDGGSDCAESMDIEPDIPLNTSIVYSFPSDHNSTLPKNANCSWLVKIPANHFAILYINASVPTNGSITVSQSGKHSEKFSDAHVEVALLFVAPSVRIYWRSQLAGRLHFNIQWQEYPANMTSKNYSLGVDGQSVVLDHEDTYNPVVLQATNRVSFLCLPGHRREDDVFLRTIVVFDGPDIQSPYLGSLYSIRESGVQLVSSSSVATIFSIVPIPTHHHVIVQDVSMFQNVAQLSGLTIHGDNIETIHMNASNGTSVVFTQIDDTLLDEYIISVDLQPSAQLQVFFEGLSSSHLVATYTTANNRTHLPQKLQGQVRYYLLTAGSATLVLTRDKWKANWETAFAGRRGFFTSRYWKSKQLQQDSFHFIGLETRNATEFVFSYRVLEADFVAGSSLHVVVSDNVRSIHYYDHRDSSYNEYETEWISHVGHSISAVYSSDYASSLGFFAEFQIDAAANTSFLFVCSLVFLFL